MKIFAITNHKGGVGKTTSAINIGAALAKSGKKVLLIDADAQANLTMGLGLDKESEQNLATLLLGQHQFAQVVRQTALLDVVPSSLKLAFYEKVIGAEPGYEFLLREALDGIKALYDFIIIDCPPSMGPFTFNAFVASDEFFIPTQPEYFGYEGLHTIINTTNVVRKRYNPKLRAGGIFFTKYSKSYRKNLHHDIVEAIKEMFGKEQAVMNTTIRDNVSLAEAQAKRQNIFDYAPTSNGAKDYLKLTKEIIERSKA